MLNFFMVGPERVRWELTQLEPGGPCRLAVHHAGGVIVETFASASMALLRVQELEDLLRTAVGAARLSPAGLPS